MAAEHKDQHLAAGLTLNLSSNNPFRNRAASPASPASPFDDPPPRPVSRNPFLDPALTGRASLQNIRSASEAMSTQDKPSSPTAEDLFGSLSIEEKKVPSLIPTQPDAAKAPVSRRGPSGRENMPPPGRRGPPPNHRPSRSQEEALRARRMQANGINSVAGPSDPSRSPQRRQGGRPRRNSESSVLDSDKVLTEEEKKARDARRRERERRHRENRDKKPVSRKLDIIDQLDATSIYGTGIFHHDGPFDALNPHRNKSGSRRAPMQAFPKDSLNNVIGGSGPLNVRPDHATLMGRHDDEAFKEWSSGAKDEKLPTGKGEMPVFDPLSRGVLHGDESLGLGTSTFLEGTPAARTAIQKREEERVAETFNEGLQRKKSLAQRIRGINRGPRDGFQPSGRMTNPDGIYSRRSPSDGGLTSSSMQAPSSERNPFFSEFDTGKKGEENISVRRTDANGNQMSPTSPRGFGLERRSTTDATAGAEDGYSKPAGFLGRMKSLKGGRRTRPAPPGGDNNNDLMGLPGTAV
ncbi:Pal1 cell morphology protein-domain-containing protein [Apodospora peruviana]|uniref:Pal1 cell morphology protein-domain-containing protein n=1 Tax=Apodospora peruviana TaxID=516989 RepID=A0AAE0IUN6_9PEZI|nr:Pal1 cell morphology protein-domain-containing protein [Apodospora peruviana]